jgi:hypothetical protein
MDAYWDIMPDAAALILPWFFILPGVGQLIAGILELKRGDIVTGTLMGFFGTIFCLTLGIGMLMTMWGTPYGFVGGTTPMMPGMPTAIGLELIGCVLFFLAAAFVPFVYAASYGPRVPFYVFCIIPPALVWLGTASLGWCTPESDFALGIILAIAFLLFLYLAAAEMLAFAFKREVLPLGTPARKLG